MRAGEFPNGARVLRAKIDMASPNINLRDPVLYRILHATHPRTGDAWCIYPTYDFAHGQSDAIEGVTHSLCTLEFEAHRPLYDWLIEHLPVPSQPHQYRVRAPEPHVHRAVEALPAAARQRGPRARLGRPAHADDLGPAPARLPGRGRSATSRRDRRPKADTSSSSGCSSTPSATCSTGPRRGVSACSIRSRSSSTNYPEGQVEEMDVVNNPEDPVGGHAQGAVRARAVDRARRLHGGAAAEVLPARARAARCGCGARTSSPARTVVKDADGNVTELRCTYDPATRGGDSPDGRRPKATLHWVSAAARASLPRFASTTISSRAPTRAPTATCFADLNPRLRDGRHRRARRAVARPSARSATTVQFERLGYFTPTPIPTPGHPVFNRTLTLKDTWAKVQRQG